MLTQFTDKLGRVNLSNYLSLEKDVYPIGRLDYDSEGLLLLSNDKKIVDFVLNPMYQHEKEYLVQVEGNFTPDAKSRLKDGVLIEGRITLPAKVSILDYEPTLPERNPPVRFRKTVPTSWIRIVIIEGKKRQVRRMTAAVGYPTLRLIRVRIENIRLGELKSGEFRLLTESEIKELKNKLCMKGK